jgi:hypothetical protein
VMNRLSKYLFTLLQRQSHLAAGEDLPQYLLHRRSDDRVAKHSVLALHVRSAERGQKLTSDWKSGAELVDAALEGRSHLLKDIRAISERPTTGQNCIEPRGIGHQW